MNRLVRYSQSLSGWYDHKEGKRIDDRQAAVAMVNDIYQCIDQLTKAAGVRRCSRCWMWAFDYYVPLAGAEPLCARCLPLWIEDTTIEEYGVEGTIELALLIHAGKIVEPLRSHVISSDPLIGEVAKELRRIEWPCRLVRGGLLRQLLRLESVKYQLKDRMPAPAASM